MGKESGKQIVPLLGIAVLASALPGLASQFPIPVSPGNGDGIAVVATTCPTFSWVPEAGAQDQELVVYELSEEGEEAGTGVLREGAEPALWIRLPGGASSWSAPVGRCLEVEGSYAWVVRSKSPDGGESWSEAAWFEVAGPAALDEVEEAVERVLERRGEPMARSFTEVDRSQDVIHRAGSGDPTATTATASTGATALGPGFLGTSGTDPLELSVDGARALRLEPVASSESGTIRPNVIGGSSINEVTAGSLGATISGGGANSEDLSGGSDLPFPNRVTDHLGTVGGGWSNQAGDDNADPATARNATVGGGQGNTAAGRFSTVGGGNSNVANFDQATVGGGSNNLVQDDGGTIAGGSGNQAGVFGGGDESFATVGGGQNNEATGRASTVAAGEGNASQGTHSTIGGGSSNVADGNRSTVGGGFSNQALGTFGTVAGGESNVAGLDTSTGQSLATVGGGSGNQAVAKGATVSGGESNTASGNHASVPGGLSNSATGSYSLAAGRRAKANHAGSFVWADSTDADFASGAADQLRVRASGGVELQTGSGGFLAEGDGTSQFVVDQVSGLGINVSSPDTNLHVAGGNHDLATTEGDLKIGDDTHRLKIGVNLSGGPQTGAANIHTHGGAERINLGAAGTQIVSIDTTSGLHPGADDTYPLGTSNRHWTEVWATDGTINTSDRRLKRDIANLDYGLAELLALRPVSFRWKDRSGNARHLGFVAQEAEEVVPEVVRAGEGEDAILGMSYAELVPLLVRAIQEQQEQIARQQTTIESQRLEIDSLRALEDRITALESSGSPRDPR